MTFYQYVRWSLSLKYVIFDLGTNFRAYLYDCIVPDLSSGLRLISKHIRECFPCL